MAIRNSEQKLPISLKNLDLNTNRGGPKNEILVSAYLSSSRKPRFPTFCLCDSLSLCSNLVCSVSEVKLFLGFENKKFMRYGTLSFSKVD